MPADGAHGLYAMSSNKLLLPVYTQICVDVYPYLHMCMYIYVCTYMYVCIYVLVYSYKSDYK